MLNRNIRALAILIVMITGAVLIVCAGTGNASEGAGIGGLILLIFGALGSSPPHPAVRPAPKRDPHPTDNPEPGK